MSDHPNPGKIYSNNILVGNDIGVEIDAGLPLAMPVVWTNNLVFDNKTSNYPPVVPDPTGTDGNISKDPLFVDRTAGNYDLQFGSPAINTGSSLGAPTVDFDGVTRQGGIDIGAFEGP